MSDHWYNHHKSDFSFSDHRLGNMSGRDADIPGQTPKVLPFGHQLGGTTMRDKNAIDPNSALAPGKRRPTSI